MTTHHADRTTTSTYPLDPLSAAEIASVAEVLRDHREHASGLRFVEIVLDEPDKLLLRAPAQSVVARRAHAVLIDRDEKRSYEAVVDLTAAAVVEWHALPVGAQPPIMLDEFDECETNCKADPRVRDALRSRGIHDLDLVCIEPWSAGFYGDEDGGSRLMRALVFVRLDPTDNPYAHPVDGLVVIYDLNTGVVVQVEDHGVIPVPQERGDYLPEQIGPSRTDIKPLAISSPEGRSFNVEGNLVQWGGWSFRVGFTPREGLVLHQMTFHDHGTPRSVINRASLVEMVVPYGDPSPIQHKKNAFDAGEYNIGALANSLALGCDCLGDIHYFDGVVCNSHGEPVVIKNAVCLHEEDDSILWKHHDFRLGTTEVRRSRKLVISFIATVANYEYGFYSYLFLDGSIEFQIKATGILSTASGLPGEKTPYGQALTNDGLYAPIHQHIFNVRLDFELDGQQNSVFEVDTVLPEDNPTRSAFHTVERIFEREQDAVRRASPERHRFWKIGNRNRRNAVGEPVAYKLQPSDAITLAAASDSHIYHRAAFATNNLWVTAYDKAQRFPAGEYPNQSRGGDGLPQWISANKSIVDEDIVVWYTFGMHHVARLEDWPVMPRQHVGFLLQPHGFFDRNPTLDLPRPAGFPDAPGHCGCE